MLRSNVSSRYAEWGLYKGSLKGLSPFERQRAAEYIADGSKLERIEEGTTKTADFIIDGKVTEFKALQSDKLVPNTAVGALQDATEKEGVQVLLHTISYLRRLCKSLRIHSSERDRCDCRYES